MNWQIAESFATTGEGAKRFYGARAIMIVCELIGIGWASPLKPAMACISASSRKV